MVITHIQRGVIAAGAVVSLVSAAFMPDYTGQDISMEYDASLGREACLVRKNPVN